MITEEQLREVVKIVKRLAVEAASRIPLASPLERLGVALTIATTASVELQEEMEKRFGRLGRSWLNERGFQLDLEPESALEWEPAK